MNRTTFSLLLAAASTSLACTTANPNYCDEGTPCANAEAPFCDVAGEFPASDGVANRCIPTPAPDAPACTSSDAFLRCDDDILVRCGPDLTEETATCALGCNPVAGACNDCAAGETTCTDDTATTCDANGSVIERTACALGCHATESRCNEMVPSNGLGDYLELAARSAAQSLEGKVYINTDTGTVIDSDGNLVPIPSYAIPPERPSEIGVRVFIAASLSIDDAKATGSLGLVLVAAEDLVLNGELVVRAGSMPHANSCTGQEGQQIGNQFVGCGGGGGRTRGAKGGPGHDGTDGAAGGSETSGHALRPLRGGCAGGVWNVPFSISSGGGAVQIVAGRRLELSAGAVIDANAPVATGAGGGSGGGVLLEAPIVSLGAEAGLFANGAAGDSLCSLSETGQGGQRSREPAQPYDCNRLDIALSGSGGTGRVAPGVGSGAVDVDGQESYAGNGGGSAGFIRINTRDAKTEAAEDALVEPAPRAAEVEIR